MAASSAKKKTISLFVTLEQQGLERSLIRGCFNGSFAGIDKQSISCILMGLFGDLEVCGDALLESLLFLVDAGSMLGSVSGTGNTPTSLATLSL